MIVALGSNLPGDHGDSRTLLEAALDRFPAHGLEVAARSGWWRSAAWPDPAGPAYTNGVALVETGLTAEATHRALQAIEQAFGRERGEANAARTLDLDLIAYGRLEVNDPALTLPHPRAHRRLFVMGPLATIAPDWVHPRLRVSAADLARRCDVGTDAAPF
ncbi:MAG: 2-amino-4-hydroxy-6-hydroxymethyldihydropteridine diphosphokinase [Caulobacter sp.]|nr:2-amino-4-hydroxy-6-hydroxymethyldihydropteridine diphosphokinase [Caulobacter sp.]